MTPRLKEQYDDEIAGALAIELELDNVMRIPRLEKIVVNMGVGDAAQDAKQIDSAVDELSTITGQRPKVAYATKSISNFKLREGVPVAIPGTRGYTVPVGIHAVCVACG